MCNDWVHETQGDIDHQWSAPGPPHCLMSVATQYTCMVRATQNTQADTPAISRNKESAPLSELLHPEIYVTIH